MKSKLFTKKMFIPVILVLALLMGACVIARNTVVKERMNEMAYWDEFDPKMSSDGLYLISFIPDQNNGKVGNIQFYHGRYYHLPISDIPCYYEDIKITSIAENSYVECIGLEKVIIPQTIEYIDKNAFLNCKDLKEIYIPASVTSISKTAFSGTSDFKMYVEKNSNAENFAKENSIEFSYYTPEPTKKDNLDYSKMMFEEMIDYNVYSIYYYDKIPACAYMKYNTMNDAVNYTVPNEIKNVPIKNITDETFMYCNNVLTITLSKNISTVGTHAFAYCRNLEKVYFTEYVTSIGNDIFSNSPNAVICAPKNSYAHKYAIENNIPFEETK